MQMSNIYSTHPMEHFWGQEPPRPKPRFVDYPADCIYVSNVVTQSQFNMPVCGADIMQKYPFCRRNSKNWRAVLILSDNPRGAASVYDVGMMMITGCTSARASRYAADRYVDFLRNAGYKDLEIVDFKIINITTTFAFSATFDAEKYKSQVYPQLIYLPDSFVGARKKCDRTGALLTLFMNKGTALGSADLRNLCYDVRDEIDKMKPCMAPFGSEEEANIVARAKDRRKRTVKRSRDPP